MSPAKGNTGGSVGQAPLACWLKGGPMRRGAVLVSRLVFVFSLFDFLCGNFRAEVSTCSSSTCLEKSWTKQGERW